MTDTICLITAAIATDFEDPGEAQSRQVRVIASAPKLGLLTLAAVLERAGIRASIFNLDEAYLDYLAEDRCRGREAFASWVASQIISRGADLIGLSSLCSSYPLTIRIAESVKYQKPSCTILLGGPQASATDLATLRAFPFVDFILRGEADLSLPLFVSQWSGDRRFSDIPGLTWRSPFGVQKNPDAPLIEDLDDLPLPAYHLCNSLKEAEYALLELGRGCPFACTFCSTNDFFRRKFRVKSPERMLSDMRAISSLYGFSGFTLVHDLFTVDRRKVVAFCEALIAAKEDFVWSCSARTDCVDEALLELMARAGCNSIFFGVETGSKRMQRIIDKHLDPAQARAAVEAAERMGIATTVSLIGGFPEENEDDLRQTLDVFMHAMRHPRSTPQFNLLAPLAGTPVYSQEKDRMVLDDLSSQLAYPGRSQSSTDRELVRAHPEIFPNFYLVPTSCLDRPSLVELAEFLPMGAKKLRWLYVALYQRHSDILAFFCAWREHRIALHPDMSGSGLRRYYTRDSARLELVAFVRERMAEFGGTAVEAMVTYEENLARAAVDKPTWPNGPPVNGRVLPSSIPVRIPGLKVIELDCDIQAIIDGLKRGDAAAPTSTRRYYRTADAPRDEMYLIEITPLVAQALLMCDGAHTVTDFIAKAGEMINCPEELRGYAARTLLKLLRDQGMIEIYQSDARRNRSKAAMAVSLGVG